MNSKKKIEGKPGTTEYKKNFNKLNYKRINLNIKPADFDIIDRYCKDIGISKAKFIIAACKYCIDNNIDL